MTQSKGIKTQLNMVQQVVLADWFRKLLPEFQQERPSQATVAEKATVELGFPVSVYTISQMQKAWGKWEGKKNRKEGVQPTVVKPSYKIKQLTRILIRFMDAVEYRPNESDQRILQRLAELLPAEETAPQSDANGATTPPAVAKAVAQTFPASRRL